MIHIQTNFNNFFEELLADIDCQPTTRIYIISIYTQFKNTKFDISKDSITLQFSQARYKQDFLTFQTVGNYLFFSSTIAPQFLKNASKDYYDTIARSSYYSCYKIINRQMPIYEELADNFNYLENQVKERLPKLMRF